MSVGSAARRGTTPLGTRASRELLEDGLRARARVLRLAHARARARPLVGGRVPRPVVAARRRGAGRPASRRAPGVVRGVRASGVAERAALGVRALAGVAPAKRTALFSAVLAGRAFSFSARRGVKGRVANIIYKGANTTWSERKPLRVQFPTVSTCNRRREWRRGLRLARDHRVVARRASSTPPPPPLFLGANWRCSVEDARAADALASDLGAMWRRLGTTRARASSSSSARRTSSSTACAGGSRRPAWRVGARTSRARAPLHTGPRRRPPAMGARGRAARGAARPLGPPRRARRERRVDRGEDRRAPRRGPRRQPRAGETRAQRQRATRRATPAPARDRDARPRRRRARVASRRARVRARVGDRRRATPCDAAEAQRACADRARPAAPQRRDAARGRSRTPRVSAQNARDYAALPARRLRRRARRARRRAARGLARRSSRRRARHGAIEGGTSCCVPGLRGNPPWESRR